MRRKGLSLMAAVLILILSGCGQKPEQEAPRTVEEVPADTSAGSEEPEEAVYDDSLITESVTEEGSFRPALDDAELTYVYHVPQLVGDTEVIREINREIDEILGSQVRADLERIKSGERYLSPRAVWTSFWKDSLLSLRIEWDDSFLYEGTVYYVINYDFKSDKRLSNRGLLDYAGVDEEKFLWAARRALMQEFDSVSYGYPDEEGFIDLYYADCFGSRSVMGRRASLLSGVDLESMQICLDGEGCSCIIPEGSPDSEEKIYHLCDLDLAPVFDVEKEVSDGIVTALLRNNELYISFEDSADFDWPEIWIGKRDAEYRVQGLYSDYKDIFLGTVGEGYIPYLFLVTKDDRLEFVDVIGGAESGMFCAMPIAGEVNVAGGKLYSGMSEDPDQPGYSKVFAEDGDGNVYDLTLWTEAACRAVPVGSWYSIVREVKDEQGSYSYSVMANLTLDEIGHFRLNITELDAETAAYEGQMIALGMTEEGMMCEYALWSVDSPDCKIGVFACRDTREVDSDLWYDVLQMKVASGDAPYEAEGEWSSFYRLEEYDEYGSDTELFYGEWWDSWSSRCHMMITETEEAGKFHIRIGWSDSAFTGGEWNMTGVYVSNGYHTALEYEDCVCTTVAYGISEEDNEVLAVGYTGGSGCISLSEPGTLLWEDYVENAGEMCVFKRPGYYD